MSGATTLSFESASLPFLWAVVLQTKIETKVMKPSRYMCYFCGKMYIVKKYA